MKLKLLIVAVLIVLLVGLVSMTAGMAKPERQWVPSFADENSYSVNALEEYKGWLYAASQNNTAAGSIIYRTKDGSNWIPVSQPAFGQTPNIPEGLSLWGDYINSLVVFQGRLYADYAWALVNSDWSDIRFLAQVWRSANGTDWEAVVPDGWGDPLNGIVDQLAVFNDRLYAAVYPAGGLGARIYRSPNGVDWEMAADADQLDCPDDGGGYHFCEVTGMAAFNDRLFVAMADSDLNGVQVSASVWSTQDGVNWQAVTQDGFGNPLNINPGGFVIFKGALYLGLESLYDSSEGWGAGKAALFRTTDGMTWQDIDLTVLEEQAFWKVEGGTVFDGRLYLNADNWNGMGVWVSSDGLNWELTNDLGFGDPESNGSYHSNDSAVFNGDLYVGISRFGYSSPGQVWRYCKDCK